MRRRVYLGMLTVLFSVLIVSPVLARGGSAPKTTGGVRAELRIPSSLTNIKCLHYSLSQPGVSCVVSGPKTVQELRSTLSYFHSSEESRSYQSELVLLNNY